MTDEKRGLGIFSLLRRVYLAKSVFTKILLALLLAFLLALLFPRGESIELDYKIGAIWAQKDLIAPFAFPILRDEREYQQEVDEARKKVYDVFERDTLETEGQLARVQDFFRQLQAAEHLRAFLARPPRGPDADRWVRHAESALRSIDGAAAPEPEPL